MGRGTSLDHADRTGKVRRDGRAGVGRDAIAVYRAIHDFVVHGLLFHIGQDGNHPGKAMHGLGSRGKYLIGRVVVGAGQAHLLQIVGQRARLADSRTFWTAGKSSATSTPMMAITTNNSISVKPPEAGKRRRPRKGRVDTEIHHEECGAGFACYYWQAGWGRGTPAAMTSRFCGQAGTRVTLHTVCVKIAHVPAGWSCRTP